MASYEAPNEWVTPAAVAVTNAIGSGQDIVSVGFAALTASQQARVCSVLIGVETESIRFGGPEVTTTRGPVLAAGSLIDLPWRGAPIFASSISATNASVSCSFGLV